MHPIIIGQRDDENNGKICRKNCKAKIDYKNEDEESALNALLPRLMPCRPSLAQDHADDGQDCWIDDFYVNWL